jgi:DNA helicase-2/ATP-dependent DNA helicase PcrA
MWHPASDKIPPMDISPILDPLNDAQRGAVTSTAASTLVLAGAGSGKTRVLVHRIAWICRVEGVSPYGILAVTFTNKAAKEMRSRVEALLELAPSGMWVGTFHGLSHRLLRTHWQEAGLPQAFQILDSEDQYRLIRRLLKGLHLEESEWPPRQVQWYINARKDEGLRPRDLAADTDPASHQYLRIYTAYEAACERSGLVDFAELLLRSLELLREHGDLLYQYRNRFRHILVDEFQDTNAMQYAWLQQLAGARTPVFAVGDDDQSIYGWRGARIENIQHFSRDFHDCEIFRLEQNYRSTGTILAAANGLICNNEGRLGKSLWTRDEEGEPIRVYAAYNEQDEARFVVDTVGEWVARDARRSDIAVLYRSNAQSRVFEELFVAQAIPYRVYGGLRFFERAEIKDALAYLRLSANRYDDASFERVVNLPARGIGERTVAVLRELAREHQISMWVAAAQALESRALSARAGTAVRGFLGLMEALDEAARDLPLHEQVEQIVERSALKTHYAKEGGEKGQARIENLEELVNAARGFNFDPAQFGDMSRLDAFLAHAALEAGEGQGESWDDCVQLMTLHSAKGLEFPMVMMVGMEEGLFPHSMSIADSGRLEEERRLCYVGITRARHQLVLSYAESRRQHGSQRYNQPSRFIGELSPELIHEVRPRVMVSQPLSRHVAQRDAPESDTGLRIGQRVSHSGFGEGVVLDCEGQGRHARVQVNFESVGSKWLVLEYAKLQAL